MIRKRNREKKRKKLNFLYIVRGRYLTFLYRHDIDMSNEHYLIVIYRMKKKKKKKNSEKIYWFRQNCIYI